MIEILGSVANLLCEVREKSPDAETKVGAVLLTPVGLKVKSVGFNQFATEHDYPATRPEKYAYMIHAEASIVAQLGRAECENHKLVVTHAPCNDCVKLLIHAGIAEVWFFESHLALTVDSIAMLRNAGVKVFRIGCHVEEFKGGQGIEVDQLA